MPELPEVETIARQLDGIVVGKKISQVEVLAVKSFVGEPDKLVGSRIKTVDRHSKMVVFLLDQEDRVILIHLKMTGQLVWRPQQMTQIGEEYQGKQVVGGHPTKDWNANLPNSHTRVIITFSDKSVLFFNDMRKFGWIKLLEKAEFEQLRQKMPPDIIDSDFSEEKFKLILSRSSRAIKLVLMDQSKIGGIGNIYANDALNLAKINPSRPAKELSISEAKRLFEATKKVIKLGIRYGGATYSNYRDTKGQGGHYQEHFLTYGRDGEKCKNCGGEIKKFTLGGRGTYWCPECQK